MFTEIAAGFASLKAATDIASAMTGMMKAAEVNEVRLTLQQHLLSAQQALFAAQQEQAATAARIRDLEQEIVRMKDWAGERVGYELRAVSRGVLAYMKKPSVENAEPPHWLCASCFDHGKKSILQMQGKGNTPGINLYGCPSCSTKVAVQHFVRPGQEEP